MSLVPLVMTSTLIAVACVLAYYAGKDAGYIEAKNSERRHRERRGGSL